MYMSGRTAALCNIRVGYSCADCRVSLAMMMEVMADMLYGHFWRYCLLAAPTRQCLRHLWLLLIWSCRLDYLEHMRAFWLNLLQNDTQWMQRLDSITLKALRRRAPAVSIDDFAYLYDKAGKGAMFHALNEWERITILAQLKSFDCLILLHLYRRLQMPRNMGSMREDLATCQP